MNTCILFSEYMFFCRVFQADCPDGKLYKSKIIDMYAMIIPRKNASILVDHIFRVFDKDSNGFIDFRVNWKKNSAVDISSEILCWQEFMIATVKKTHKMPTWAEREM